MCGCYLNLNNIKQESLQQYYNKTDSSQSTLDNPIFSTDNNSEKDVKVIAHRGDSDEAPENTIPAYELAVKNGYEYAECDISWTKDDVPVLLHDSTIDRTAGLSFFFNIFNALFGTKCEDITYDELLDYDFGLWFDEKYKDTKIPTFEEALKCAHDNNLNLYVELKDNGDFNPEKAQTLIDCATNEDMLDNITWISFNDDNLKYISDLLPNARLGYLTDTYITDRTVNILNELKTESNTVFLDIKASKITEAGVDKLKNAGFVFECWTVNDIGKVEKLDNLDCKGYTTDTLTKDEVEEAVCK